MSKRQQGDSRLEISWCWKNKWDKDWMRYWFYVQTFGVTTTHEDGKKSTRYPLASIVTEMKPMAKVNPSDEMTLEREACDRAFALACRYSGGRDLVEEMATVRFWPLGKSKPSFKIEMVNLPIYGEADGVSFPYFGIILSEEETPEDFIAALEQEAWEIVGDITNKEFLARRAIADTMP